MGKGKRIPVELVRESAHPDVAATFERLSAKSIGIVNIHRTIANSPLVFTRFIGLAHALRFETALDPADRELAILCVLERHEGDYELVPHRRLGREAGLSDEQMENVRTPEARPDIYTERQRAVLRFAERFAADPSERNTLPEDGIEAFLDNRQRIELALTLALYLGLSHFTGVLDVPAD